VSSASGSLMWMSPERLLGHRTNEAVAMAGDVYR
jgi:hypothetical protein